MTKKSLYYEKTLENYAFDGFTVVSKGILLLILYKQSFLLCTHQNDAWLKEEIMLISTIDFEHKDAQELFHEIYTDNYKLMYKVAYDILRNKEDAEDAVHAAFVSLAESFDEIESIDCSRISGLCALISKHKATDIVRKKKHVSTKQIDEYEWLDENPERSPEICFERKEMVRYVKELLSKLPDSTKDIMILKYYYGLSCAEISKIVGLSSKTVEMRVYRAKLKIREIVGNEDNAKSLE